MKQKFIRFEQNWRFDGKNSDGTYLKKYRFSRGEFRAPKRGEWYLSGAILSAYRAPNDLSTEFRIVTPILEK